MTYHMVQYTNIINELRQEIVRLQKKIADQDDLKESPSHQQETKGKCRVFSKDPKQWLI